MPDISGQRSGWWCLFVDQDEGGGRGAGGGQQGGRGSSEGVRDDKRRPFYLSSHSCLRRPSLPSSPPPPAPAFLQSTPFASSKLQAAFSSHQRTTCSSPSPLTPLSASITSSSASASSPSLFKTLYWLCHSKHLVVQAPLGEDAKYIDLNDAFWSRLHTIKLVEPACVRGKKLRWLARINVRHLRLVTYDLSTLGRHAAVQQMWSVVVHLPLLEVVQVVVFVRSKGERKLFRALLKSRVDGELLPAGVEGQIKVKVRAS